MTIRAATTICAVSNHRLRISSTTRRWQEAIRLERFPAYIEQFRLKKTTGAVSVRAKSPMRVLSTIGSGNVDRPVGAHARYRPSLDRDANRKLIIKGSIARNLAKARELLEYFVVITAKRELASVRRIQEPWLRRARHVEFRVP